MGDEPRRLQFRISTISLLTAVLALAISLFLLTARHNAQLMEMTQRHNTQLAEFLKQMAERKAWRQDGPSRPGSGEGVGDGPATKP